MENWYENLKPRASSGFQLLLAGAMWTLVGAGLLVFGSGWIIGAVPPLAATVLCAAGALLGILKSRYILDKTARKIVERIASRGEGRCAGGFLSLRSWAFVLVMILAGRILRSLILPSVAGTLYVAVGVGLLLSSRLAWKACLKP